MSGERWARIEEMFHGAVSLAPEDRASFLESACEGNIDLRREMESLLAHADHKQVERAIAQALEAYPDDAEIDSKLRALFAQNFAGDIAHGHPSLAGTTVTQKPASLALLPGTTIGEYEVIALLGAGGMGEVYRARDVRLRRDVAIKVLPAFVSDDLGRLQRFEQEARAAAALNHPNILAVFQMGSHAGVPYLVSELLEGSTLREQLVRNQLSWTQAIEVALQICRGLAAAHDKGIVHRDLKPENLFITSDERVKILDFGLAKLVRKEPTTSAPTGLTEAGTIMGTLGYMSPEQVRGQGGDCRSDVFAFGAILYEMLTGERAFSGESAADVISAILTRDPSTLLRRKQNIPSALKSVMQRCLEKNLEQRFQSGRDLLLNLESISASRGRGISKKWVPITAAIMLIGFAGWKIYEIHSANTEGARFDKIDSLAVLPLANFSGDASQDYFADGMTESLITDLAKIGVPRVISRTSAMSYKGTHKSVPEIAKELNVNGIVEGSVVRSGDRVRVTAQLIFAPSDRHVWAETFDRSTRDILNIENDVAQSIATAIQLKITPRQKAVLLERRSVNPESHDDYLRGRFFWNQRTEASLKKAEKAFADAIAKDPGFAPAYSGLADTYFYLGYAWGHMAPKQAMPLAKRAAEKALELDGSSAEGHTSLAIVEFFYDWKFNAAEEELKRAISLDPNYAFAHHVYASLLLALRRPEEAVAQIHKAVEVDPLSIPLRNFLAGTLSANHHTDEAMKEVFKTFELDPNAIHAAMLHETLAECYKRKGMEREAFEESIKAAVADGATPQEIDETRKIYAIHGERGIVERDLKSALARWERDHWHGDAFEVANEYANLGDKDQAFAWIYKLIELRSTWLIWIYPEGHPFSSDPRFAEVKRKMGVLN